jgi:hypothetical protein
MDFELNSVLFFWGEILSNFDLKNYDSDLIKGFFTKKVAQIRQIFKNK